MARLFPDDIPYLEETDKRKMDYSIQKTLSN